MPIDNETIKVTSEEKNEIKEGGVDSLPLNPTAQGFSGQEVRKRLAKSVTATQGSVLSLLEEKLGIVSDKFDEVETDLDDNYYTKTELDEGQLDTRYYTEDEADAIFALYDTTTIVDEKILLAKKIQYYPNTKNNSNETIPKGALVEFAGVSSGNVLIKNFNRTEIIANPERIMGIAEDNIPHDHPIEDTHVVWFGEITNVDLSDYTNGQILYFDSENTGALGLTSTIPSQDKIVVGAVVKNGIDGVLLVRPKWLSRKIVDITGLRGELDTIENDIEGLDTRLTTEEGNIDTLQSDVNTAEQDIDNLEGRMDTAESDIDDVEDRATSLEGRMTTAENDIDAIEADYVHNTSEIAGNVTIEGERIDLESTDGNIYLTPANNDAVVVGNLKVEGDLIIDGESIVVDFEQVTVNNNTITLRDNAVSGLGAGQFAGLIAKNADGANDSGLLFNGDGIARVGDITVVDGVITSVAQTQALATREDSPVNDGIAHWDSATSKFETNSNLKLVNNYLYINTLIANMGSLNNASITPSSTGTIITRNQTDANPALIVNQANASSIGNILQLRKNDTNRITVTHDGVLNWGAQANQGSLTWDANKVMLGGLVGNALELRSNNSTQMTIDTSGNVGIGITDPQYKLDVNGTVRIGTGGSIQPLLLRDGATGGLIVKTTGNGGASLIVQDNTNERFRITSDGNVGIGTTNPQAKLDVNGVIKTNDEVIISKAPSNTVGEGPLIYLESGSNTSYSIIQQMVGRLGFCTYNNAWYERMSISGTNGNVGIGTKDPVSQLHIKGSNASVRVDRYTTDYGATYQWAENGNLLWDFKVDYDAGNNNSLQLANATNPLVTFEQDGNVGIGTTSPHTKLTTKVSNSQFGNVTTNTDNQVRVGQYVDSNGNGRLYLYDTSNNNNVLINTEGISHFMGGNVGIGTTSPGDKLDIIGSIRVSDGTDNGTIYFRKDRNDSVIYEDKYRLFMKSSNGLSFDFDTNGNGGGDFRITDQGLTKFMLNDDGNVGISNTTPQEKLDVTGNARVSGQYQYGTNAYTEYNATDQTIDFVFN